ncbi:MULTISPECIES: potassium-transporting ATPase subunit F [Paenibacillus]|uniref:Potassium-transporting ATPase subunit F n=2 Tax=Paenibacillus TaxID=44249 RepID=A0A2N9ZLL4_PAEPO|nr:K(+)-transporting ATPase subunit F [Paenibacillus polymyxa]KAF6577010.1 potassium-transporting ATPase subunit F [Paenibacillus sp. EKM206P]KAF6581894.1 potassium-transporting ATPase subunit F [Paenibacillus sp. EKM212P]KAF6591564.1 potassium-transporting ATPase subunit F [Paenibacillus sp. EKM205P]KAF6633264.1 potassium-transporting ATPase subunit F [Paenibacillus sp. EKM208P]MXO79916.1 potassium-transporting ATPase subunit F [Paenibacillus sp. OT2-17]OME66020.1 hypothetical protein BK119_
MIVILGLTAIVFMYLIYALLNPEKF